MNVLIYLAIEFILLVIIFFVYHKSSLKKEKIINNKDLEHQLEMADAQIDQLQDDKSELKKQINSLDHKVDKLTQKNTEREKINAKLEGKLDRMEELQEKNQQKEKKIEKLQQEKESLREDISELSTRLEEQQKANQEKLENLQKARKELKEEFENLANKIFEQKKEKSTENINQVISPLKDQIKEFKKKVEDVYDKESKDRAKLENEIKNLKQLNNQISEDAENLTKALKGSSKTQGDWGEVVLERLLEFSGLKKGEMFETQKVLSTDQGKRYKPDVIVHLPNERDVVIDSKVSLTAYEKYYNEDNDKQRSKFLDQHLKSVRNHMKNLSAKNYEELRELNTLDYVIMFIPVEGAYITTVQTDRSIIEDGMDKNIMVVGPSTLLATLRTIENFWKFKKQTDNAREIARRGGKLYDKFVNFVDSLEEVGKNLDRAQDSYKTAKKRLSDGQGNLIRQTEMLKDLGADAQKELPDELKD